MTSQRDREHIFERLRCGVVPERGLVSMRQSSYL